MGKNVTKIDPLGLSHLAGRKRPETRPDSFFKARTFHVKGEFDGGYLASIYQLDGDVVEVAKP